MAARAAQSLTTGSSTESAAESTRVRSSGSLWARKRKAARRTGGAPVRIEAIMGVRATGVARREAIAGNTLL